MEDIFSLLNKIPAGERHLGNWIAHRYTFGDIKYITVPTADGGNALVIVQAVVVRPSGGPIWIANASYNGRESRVVSARDEGTDGYGRYAGPHGLLSGKSVTRVPEQLEARHPGRGYGGSHSKGRLRDGFLFDEALVASKDSL
ncbi:hypothetical protein RvY_11313 [Ramazzottius varieornatus]|uniref:Uncharacterized protein n=1 Tax=Ramazzottius varieornatus TaxID=947166 RepID=A0A1D1VFS1_RAMVA|nr:hypothetical protein RvY_11313 [Ramazzottius varieornatus]